jgi:uncharacterized protein (TIGR03437 family)
MSLRDYAVVVRLDTTGTLRLVAGNGIPGYSGDNGPAIFAQLNMPSALAVGPDGSIYIADSFTLNVRKVSGGLISTVVSPGMLPLNAGGGNATALAVDSAGDLYIATGLSIVKISNGAATIVAGGCCSNNGFGDNIPALGANIAAGGLALDGSGNLYLADTCSNRIRKVSGGIISTVAGNGSLAASFVCPQPTVAGPDGRATSVGLDALHGVAVDAAGNVYFTEGQQHPSGTSLAGGRLREIVNGSVVTLAGGGLCPLPGCPALADSIAAPSAVLIDPNALAIDPLGNLFVSDAFSQFANIGRLRKISGGMVATAAGIQGVSAEGGPAIAAQLNLPSGIALDPAGNLLIADTASNIVREVSRGAITTVAGDRSGSQGSPRTVASDPAKGLYVSDGLYIRLVANGNSTELLAPSQLMATISDIALDSAGNFYIADTSGNRILEVSNQGITAIAGTGQFGFTGDGGPAVSAQLAGPSGLALNSAGTLYFTEIGSQHIRKITNGTITTVAGIGTAGFAGDNGPALAAELNLSPLGLGCPQSKCFNQLPAGIAVDSAGNIYFAGNQRVRKISNGTITTVAGNGSTGFDGDTGPAAGATLNTPTGIAVDAAGKVYIADSGNNRIRVLIPPQLPSAAPVISAVANAFGQSSIIAPYSWVQINGQNLAPAGDARTWTGSDFINGQLPISLDGVTVTMNGKNAYIYYISSTQINVLTPPDLDLGTIPVVVTVGGAASTPGTTQAKANSLSFFVFSGTPYVTAIHADGSLLAPTNLYPNSTPAKPGEVIQIYANGFGQSTSGSLPVLPAVMIGGTKAVVQYAGLSSPGQYQFNVVVPESSPDGDNSIIATYNGGATQPGALLSVRRQ